MLIVAGIAAALMIPAALLVRRPPVLEGGQAEIRADEPQADMTDSMSAAAMAQDKMRLM